VLRRADFRLQSLYRGSSTLILFDFAFSISAASAGVLDNRFEFEPFLPVRCFNFIFRSASSVRFCLISFLRLSRSPTNLFALVDFSSTFVLLRGSQFRRFDSVSTALLPPLLLVSFLVRVSPLAHFRAPDSTTFSISASAPRCRVPACSSHGVLSSHPPLHLAILSLILPIRHPANHHPRAPLTSSLR